MHKHTPTHTHTHTHTLAQIISSLETKLFDNIPNAAHIIPFLVRTNPSVLALTRVGVDDFPALACLSNPGPRLLSKCHDVCPTRHHPPHTHHLTPRLFPFIWWWLQAVAEHAEVQGVSRFKAQVGCSGGRGGGLITFGCRAILMGLAALVTVRAGADGICVERRAF